MVEIRQDTPRTRSTQLTRCNPGHSIPILETVKPARHGREWIRDAFGCQSHRSIWAAKRGCAMRSRLSCWREKNQNWPKKTLENRSQTKPRESCPWGRVHGLPAWQAPFILFFFPVSFSILHPATSIILSVIVGKYGFGSDFLLQLAHHLQLYLQS